MQYLQGHGPRATRRKVASQNFFPPSTVLLRGEGPTPRRTVRLWSPVFDYRHSVRRFVADCRSSQAQGGLPSIRTTAPFKLCTTSLIVTLCGPWWHGTVRPPTWHQKYITSMMTCRRV